MPSQIDLDQGGTYRQKIKVFMGHSIGWVEQQNAILRVTSAGVTVIQLGNFLVLVNVNGAVTLTLPPAKAPAAIGQPGAAPLESLMVVDQGGFAGANPITVNPTSPDLIDGLASVQLSTAFGVLVLTPDPVNGNWSITT
jgi:hypothetical protein